MNNIILSVSYLEFINDIDNLINKFLYSQDGYYSLYSKNAINSADEFMQKFNYELNNLKIKANFDNCDEIIKNKQEEFSALIEKHYGEQILVWIDEVYQKTIDNCLFKVSIDKDNNAVQNYFKLGLDCIFWLCEIKKNSQDEKNSIINKFKKDFALALKSTDNDYIIQNSPENSDKKLFLKLRNLIIKNCDAFKKLDFSVYTKNLSQADIDILNCYQKDLLTYKKTQLIDEINLVNAAVKILSLNDSGKIYDFIKQIENDFTNLKTTQKNFDEEMKIKILKRRIALYDKKSNGSFEYFKKMLT